MRISKQNLKDAAHADIVSSDQVDALWSFLLNSQRDKAEFSFTHLLYYFGGLIAIGAMVIFVILAEETFGGLGFSVVSFCYMAVAFWLLRRFAAEQQSTAAGICGAFIVVVTPMVFYGLQQALGLWPDHTLYREHQWSTEWLFLSLSLSALVMGLVLVWRFRYPFVVMPMTVTLWYSLVYLAIVSSDNSNDWDFRVLASLWAGLIMLLLALVIDIKNRSHQDYSFWLYMLGTISFWLGLTALGDGEQWETVTYLLINLSMMVVGIVLMRRIFVVCGALGCCLYLGHLASDVFQDSWLFPLALTGLGGCVVYLGILWQKHEAGVIDYCWQHLPNTVTKYLSHLRQ
ncbi:DUF2157 domain-containing protein [Corallincola holothuriorum]|uniref:DUF2157 domain-containing protein n=1 Tax=Corallincola holothuriorum TaxID=2282215 RepID=A0A368NGE0_9GAMM|nr:DUF2157 domain-containing protein [Corallincola holothuriorum]RCU49180.1 DUF2157 domain-containing protein [Corallincola holothuriorum]